MIRKQSVYAYFMLKGNEISKIEAVLYLQRSNIDSKSGVKRYVIDLYRQALFLSFEIKIVPVIMQTCHSFRFYLNHSDFFLNFREVRIN